MGPPLVRLTPLSAVPGLVHGFERRRSATGPETREEGRARMADALASQGRLFFLRQVHGARVVEAPWGVSPAADASVSRGASSLLGIETADCLPVLFVDPRLRVVAAAHAGWRGTAALVVRKTVEALEGLGSRAPDLLVGIGPGIGACCYEVGPEVRAAFGAAADGAFAPGSGGRLHLDIRAANVRQLLDAGVPAGSVFHVDECTSCRADLYHSYRRDGRGGGRMISFVGFAAP
jgi:YfiH family protein